MRAICGLFALLIMLGPIGMGIMLNADSPYLEDDALSTAYQCPVPTSHGTRSSPSQSPTFVNLYFRSNEIMNTTASTSINTNINVPGSGITFLLQKELINDFKIENPSPGYPIVAKVILSGNGDVTVTVRDNAGGTVVGSQTHSFTYGTTPTAFDINIPFATGTNYTFSDGHFIEIEFDFSNTGRIHYDSDTAPSRLQFYGTTIPDITIETANFFDWETESFYSNDIDFPDERKKIKMKGVITEVFGKENLFQYVDKVEVNIVGPGYNETRTTSYFKSDFSYSYTWSYPYNQAWGEYTVTTIVTDEQANQFSVKGTFNMSQYGVLLTSPSQVPEEGSFQAIAKNNLVQKSTTIYEINVHNIGAEDSGFYINTTSSLSGWDWWLGDDGLDAKSNKTGSINSIAPGDFVTITLVVDAKNNDLGSKARIDIIATSSLDSSEEYILKTVSEVVLRYDVELEFAEGSQKTLEKKIETGDTINIGFSVTNDGGENDDINIGLSLVPAGWTLSLEGPDLEGSQGNYHVFLTSGDITSLTLIISTPSDKGEEEVAIDITGRSQGSADQLDNPVASDKLTVNVKTSTGLSLTLDDFIEKDVDPDQDIAFKFKIENTGTKLANFTVTFSGFASSDGWELGDASFDPSGYNPTKEFNNLAPNNPQDFWLYIEPTIEVISKNYTIQIHAENNQASSSKFANQLVFCWINELYNIEIVEPLSLELSDDAEPGEDVEYTIIIENNGNVKERVSVSVDKPGDWKLDFGNVSEDWIKDIEPGDTETIPIVLTVPKDAKGDETVDITITIVPANSDIIQVETHTTIKQTWFEPLLTLLVPLLLFIVILVMVVVIYKRR